jgi:hypothetical protein
MPSARRMIAATTALAAVVATAAAMTALSAPPSRASQADSVRAIERSRLRALVAADVRAARKLIAADFQLINPAGDPLSRDELLGGVKAGAIDFLAIEPISQIAVRTAGRSATPRYRARFDLVAGGTHLTHDAWTTLLYQRHRGRWRVVWEQTTAVPNDPELFIRSLLPKN